MCFEDQLKIQAAIDSPWSVSEVGVNLYRGPDVLHMSSNIPRKVALGCGTDKPEGFYGVDIHDTPAVDLVQDLEDPSWNLPTSHFETIRAIDVFEHLSNPIDFMEEVHRIATPDAIVVIRGPHFSSHNWHDPTHRRLLARRTFEHFTSESRFDFYTEVEFEVTNYKLTFEWTNLPLYQTVASWIANNYISIYERYLFKEFFPATNIIFYLSPVKSNEKATERIESGDQTRQINDQ
jgi:SAM-dependent methyltransferase